MKSFFKLLCLITPLFTLFGCASDDSNTETEVATDTSDHDFTVLFIGNSHTAGFNLPDIVKQMILTDQPTAKVWVAKATGAPFLEEHLSTNETLTRLEERHWTHVVLQAQKYSQSFTYDYSTEAAETFIKMTKTQGGTPVLYPEFGQFGRWTEGQYIHDLHSSIADRESACVAPVGLAWDMAIRLDPNLKMHAADGNHANLTGTLLTAYVLYQSITKQPAELLPELNFVDVSSATQAFLAQVASATLTAHPACERLQ